MFQRRPSLAAISGLGDRVPNGTIALALLYLLASASTFFWAYMPMQMSSLGWSGVQIGAFFMIITVSQAVATPIWSRVADRPRVSSSHLIKLQFLIAASAIAMLSIATSWLLGVVIAVLVGATMRCAPPLMDSMTLGTVGMNRFGRIRAFGTIGFGLVALLFGVVGSQLDHGVLASLAPWIMLVLLLVALPVIARLPGAGSDVGGQPERAAAARPRRSSGPSMGQLLKSPVVLLLFPVAALFVATHVPYELFLVGLAEERGFGAWLPGLAIFIGVAGELTGFLSFRKMVNKISPELIIGAVVAITGLRWIVTGMTTSPMVFAGLQILHGLTFAAFFMALLEIMSRRWGSNLGATPQGLLYLLVFAAGSGIGTLVSGILYDMGSAKTLFMQAGLASFVLLPGIVMALHFLGSKEALAARATAHRGRFVRFDVRGDIRLSRSYIDYWSPNGRRYVVAHNG